MKKLFSILTATLMLFSVSAFASSQLSLTADFRFDSLTNSYTVFGTSSDTKAGDEITVEMYFDGVLSDVKEARSEKTQNAITYETEPFVINQGKADGKVKFKVYSANGAALCEIGESEYYGISDALKDLLISVKNCMDADDFSAFSQLVQNGDNDKILGISKDILSSSSDSAIKVMKAYFNNLTLDVSDSSDSKAVYNALLKFRNDYEVMKMFGEFTVLSSKSGFLSWYDSYSPILKLSEASNEKYTYFEENYEKDKFFEILFAESPEYFETDKLGNRLLEAGALCKIALGNANDVKNVFNTYDGSIPLTYTALTSSQKSVVYGKLPSQTFSTFEKLGKKYDEYASVYYTNTTPSVTPGFTPSPSLGGTGSSSGGTITVKPDVNQSTEKKNVFADVGDGYWGKTAITELYERKIVNGRSENMFMPEENVTRAEFVKLLVLSLGKGESTQNAGFADVSENAWYCGFVNTAYELGIVNGDENGYFYPDNNITRQDMAVMIARATGENSDAVSEGMFSDFEEISDYAKSYVLKLCEKGIVSGMGNGMFSPKSTATRAQAAQIIYNLLTK